MRILLFAALLAVLVAVVSAWEKEDHEIFDLVSALEAAEGKGTDFYSWLNVPSNANLDQLNKAYRKKSMQLHPDKNRGVKGIQERFARLGVVAAILRNAESRKRYDFFYKNGVPKWRGTGYYYERFRPGVGMVLIFLVMLTSGMHYLVQKLNYNRDTGRVRELQSSARQAAWGPKLVPMEGRRKVKIPLGPQREDGSIGRTIDVVVEGNGDVFFVEGNGEFTPLDDSAATPPSIHRTWFIALCTSLYHKATGKSAAATGVNGDTVDDEDDGSSLPGTPDSEGSASTGSAAQRGASATSKAGGRRRVVKRR